MELVENAAATAATSAIFFMTFPFDSEQWSKGGIGGRPPATSASAASGGPGRSRCRCCKRDYEGEHELKGIGVHGVLHCRFRRHSVPITILLDRLAVSVAGLSRDDETFSDPLCLAARHLNLEGETEQLRTMCYGQRA